MWTQRGTLMQKQMDEQMDEKSGGLFKHPVIPGLTTRWHFTIFSAYFQAKKKVILQFFWDTMLRGASSGHQG